LLLIQNKLGEPVIIFFIRYKKVTVFFVKHLDCSNVSAHGWPCRRPFSFSSLLRCPGSALSEVESNLLAPSLSLVFQAGVELMLHCLRSAAL